MKKNSVLFGVLTVLLIATYFFQEKRVEREYADNEQKGRLFQHSITDLKWSKIEATKKNGQWWSGKILLSQNILGQMEKKLSELKRSKDVQGEWSTYFTNALTIEVNQQLLTIGDLTMDKQGFYIGLDKKIMVAFFDGGNTELTQNESELEKIKLDEFKRLLVDDLSTLKEKQLFRFYPNLSSEKVVVEADGHLPFELNLKKNKTSPPPISGIQVHEKLREKFISLLTQMTIREEIPYSENLKYKKLSSMNFIHEQTQVKWEIWIRESKSADAILIDSQAKKAYLMVGGTLRAFFIPLQDYWDKKIIPPSVFKNFSQIKVLITQDDKSDFVMVLNRQPLGFESSKMKVKNEAMEKLFQLVFNLGPFEQADRVSILSKSERKQILTESHLRMDVMGQNLLFWRKADELIVVNLTQEFKAHFLLRDEKFNARFEDVLE